jgi:6,7-dimethyl-8-ribityllumazine synthase
MSQPAGTGQAAPAPGQSVGIARIGIAVSGYHHDITDALLTGCLETLIEHGAAPQNIITLHAPGAFELPATAQLLIERHQPAVVICLGCVIRGETKHADYISHAVASGIMQLSLSSRLPVIFGVLTTDSMEQARERAGGKVGHKGEEAATAAIAMIRLRA